MNSSSKAFPYNKDSKLNSPNKVTTLNPNAAEFVPSSPGSLSGNIKNVDATRLVVSRTSGKTILDRLDSTVSSNSDDEAHQYWCHQLPDDITPDFKVMGEEESQVPGSLSLAGLSIHDRIEMSRFSTLRVNQLPDKQQDRSPHYSENISFSEKNGYSGLTYADDHPQSAIMNLAANSWDKKLMNGDQHLANGREGGHYSSVSNAGFLNDLINDHMGIENQVINPMDFLASQFPGFAAERLADVYYANGCDLSLTIGTLTQLEFQVDGGFNRKHNPRTLSNPSLSAVEFAAFTVPDAQNGLSKYRGEDLQQIPNAYRFVDKGSFPFLRSTPSGTTRGTPDFATAVHQLASQDSGHWKYDRNGSADATIGTSRNSQLLIGSYDGNGKSVYADKLQSFGAVRVAPSWLGTGDAVGNMYSESREEAHDFAHLRNTCLQQAKQAYTIGNKALAKELSVRGQYYNMQMKEAHEKARESTYQQRNQVAPEMKSYGQGQHHPLIDLHGLHVGEAIHVLKHELSSFRRTARSAGHHLQVMICVGTGHHAKDTPRTPARLLVDVEQHLLDEGLHYTEAQPGLLQVLIY